MPGMQLDISARNIAAVFAVTLCVCGCSDKDDSIGGPPSQTRGPILHLYPTWSAAGDSLYYYDRGITQVDPDGSYVINPDSAGIWVISIDGGVPRMVFPSAQLTFCLSPDGSAAVLAIGGLIQVGVFTNGKLDPDSFTPVTSQGASQYPAWGSSGEWIVFESDYLDPKGASVIWKVRFDGTGLTDVSRHGEGEWLMPSWDSAGLEIVHVRYVTDTPFPEIFVMDNGGENERRITINQEFEAYPRFSPTDSLICYESVSGGTSTIWRMGRDGSNKRKLEAGMQPNWSPNGGFIAYVQASGDSSAFGTIWIVDADGNGARQVTRGGLGIR